jgi:hypothetical protein
MPPQRKYTDTEIQQFINFARQRGRSEAEISRVLRQRGYSPEKFGLITPAVPTTVAIPPTAARPPVTALPTLTAPPAPERPTYIRGELRPFPEPAILRRPPTPPEGIIRAPTPVERERWGKLTPLEQEIERQLQAERIATTIVNSLFTPEQQEEMRKSEERLTKFIAQTPRIAFLFVSPVFTLALEGWQQFKNIIVPYLKKEKEKFSPLHAHMLAELLPRETPTLVKLAANFAESIAEVALIGALIDLTKKNLLLNSLQELEQKLRSAGYTEEDFRRWMRGEITIDLDEVLKGTTIEREVRRWFAIKGIKIRTKFPALSTDDATRYEEWLRSRYPFSPRPEYDVPLHPASEAREVMRQLGLLPREIPPAVSPPSPAVPAVAPAIVQTLRELGYPDEAIARMTPAEVNAALRKVPPQTPTPTAPPPPPTAPEAVRVEEEIVYPPKVGAAEVVPQENEFKPEVPVDPNIDMQKRRLGSIEDVKAEDVPKFIEMIKARGLGYAVVRDNEGLYEILYFKDKLPQTLQGIKLYTKYIKSGGEPSALTEREHRILGRLFGIPKGQVEEFINREIRPAVEPPEVSPAGGEQLSQADKESRIKAIETYREQIREKEATGEITPETAERNIQAAEEQTKQVLRAPELAIPPEGIIYYIDGYFVSKNLRSLHQRLQKIFPQYRENPTWVVEGDYIVLKYDGQYRVFKRLLEDQIDPEKLVDGTRITFSRTKYLFDPRVDRRHAAITHFARKIAPKRYFEPFEKTIFFDNTNKNIVIRGRHILFTYKMINFLPEGQDLSGIYLDLDYEITRNIPSLPDYVNLLETTKRDEIFYLPINEALKIIRTQNRISEEKTVTVKLEVSSRVSGKLYNIVVNSEDLEKILILFKQLGAPYVEVTLPEAGAAEKVLRLDSKYGTALLAQKVLGEGKEPTYTYTELRNWEEVRHLEKRNKEEIIKPVEERKEKAGATPKPPTPTPASPTPPAEIPSSPPFLPAAAAAPPAAAGLPTPPPPVGTPEYISWWRTLTEEQQQIELERRRKLQEGVTQPPASDVAPETTFSEVSLPSENPPAVELQPAPEVPPEPFPIPTPEQPTPPPDTTPPPSPEKQAKYKILARLFAILNQKGITKHWLERRLRQLGYRRDTPLKDLSVEHLQQLIASAEATRGHPQAQRYKQLIEIIRRARNISDEEFKKVMIDVTGHDSLDLMSLPKLKTLATVILRHTETLSAYNERELSTFVDSLMVSPEIKSILEKPIEDLSREEIIRALRRFQEQIPTISGPTKDAIDVEVLDKLPHLRIIDYIRASSYVLRRLLRPFNEDRWVDDAERAIITRYEWEESIVKNIIQGNLQITDKYGHYTIEECERVKAALNGEIRQEELTEKERAMYTLYRGIFNKLAEEINLEPERRISEYFPQIQRAQEDIPSAFRFNIAEEYGIATPRFFALLERKGWREAEQLIDLDTGVDIYIRGAAKYKFITPLVRRLKPVLERYGAGTPEGQYIIGVVDAIYGRPTEGEIVLLNTLRGVFGDKVSLYTVRQIGQLISGGIYSFALGFRLLSAPLMNMTQQVHDMAEVGLLTATRARAMLLNPKFREIVLQQPLVVSRREKLYLPYWREFASFTERFIRERKRFPAINDIIEHVVNTFEHLNEVGLFVYQYVDYLNTMTAVASQYLKIQNVMAQIPKLLEAGYTTRQIAKRFGVIGGETTIEHLIEDGFSEGAAWWYANMAAGYTQYYYTVLDQAKVFRGVARSMGILLSYPTRFFEWVATWRHPGRWKVALRYVFLWMFISYLMARGLKRKVSHWVGFTSLPRDLELPIQSMYEPVYKILYGHFTHIFTGDPTLRDIAYRELRGRPITQLYPVPFGVAINEVYEAIERKDWRMLIGPPLPKDVVVETLAYALMNGDIRGADELRQAVRMFGYLYGPTPDRRTISPGELLSKRRELLQIMQRPFLERLAYKILGPRVVLTPDRIRRRELRKKRQERLSK